MNNLIHSLQHLVLEASVASSPQKRVGGIVSQVKALMDVGVCSLYLNHGGVMTLVATEGLNESSIGAIKLRIGEGLVGRIAKTQHPLNVECASQHPDYRSFPGSGEEQFEAFLGAPVVHGGVLVGVLVVEQKTRRKFSQEEESFLTTVAAYLGGIDPDDFQCQHDGDLTGGAHGAPVVRRIRGVRGASGVGIGRVAILTAGTDLMDVTDTETDDIQAELKSFGRAVRAVLDDLHSGQKKLANNISADVAEVFDVYRMLLQSSEFSGSVIRGIQGGNSAPAALRAAVSKYLEKFEAMEDPYLRARGEDIRNLGNRVYARLRESGELKIPEDEKVVLVGSIVSIADIAAYPTAQLAGIISLEGSALSHTAVLAKALGLPAVMGVGHLGEFKQGELIIVDGHQGEVIISPPPAVLKEFEQLIYSQQARLRQFGKLKDLPAETSDGLRVNLLANTGLLSDITPGLSCGAEGIGLYRSEMPFMTSKSFPSEDEQHLVYRSVMAAYRGMPVYMRTLDIGGDKPLPYYPVVEENPALGWRGVRFTLDHSALFMTQIRAMLRASENVGGLHILLPMVSLVAEVDSFLVMLDDACAQLKEEGIVIERPRVGVMAEVPAITTLIPFLAGRIDFVSVGTNDLSQYVLAIDRSNARVTHLSDPLHPAVIDTVEKIVLASLSNGMDLSVCGEMAADPCSVVLLLAMGVETLSMAAYSIPEIKWVIRNISRRAAREQLKQVRKYHHPEQTRSHLRAFLVDQGLGGILEPGMGEIVT